MFQIKISEILFEKLLQMLLPQALDILDQIIPAACISELDRTPLVEILLPAAQQTVHHFNVVFVHLEQICDVHASFPHLLEHLLYIKTKNVMYW